MSATYCTINVIIIVLSFSDFSYLFGKTNRVVLKTKDAILTGITEKQKTGKFKTLCHV